jgi:CelD/BcsL family acetyltransferase involved in cellulose biosynthesis
MIRNLDIRTEIIQDIEYLKKTKEIWDRLLEDCPDANPFLTFAWNTAWWEVYGNSRHLFVIIIYSSVQAIGIFPLMISKKTVGLIPIKNMEFIGIGKSDYLGPIIVENPELCWHQALDTINDHSKLWDKVELGRMIEESTSFGKLLKVLTSKKTGKSIIKCQSTLGSPSILIEGDWEEYYKQCVSASNRSTTRRKMRLLEKRGKVTFSESKGKENLDHLLNEMAVLESKSWKGDTKKGILGDEQDRKFISRIASLFADSGWLSLHTLRIDKQLIAYNLGFKYDNRYYLYSPSYDSEFKSNSPGLLLIKHTIQECFQDVIEEYDFLQGEERYKLVWANKFRRIQKVLLFHHGWISLILFFYEKHLHQLYNFLKKKIKEVINRAGYEITSQKGKKKFLKKGH